jgi:hypothetical protein
MDPQHWFKELAAPDYVGQEVMVEYDHEDQNDNRW